MATVRGKCLIKMDLQCTYKGIAFVGARHEEKLIATYCARKHGAHLKTSAKIPETNSHIDKTLITLYCCNCSISLLVIVVPLLLCLIFKLNFTIGMYYRKKYSTYRVQFCLWCQHPLGI